MARLAQSLRANSIFIAMVAAELSRTPKRPLIHKKPAQDLAMRVFEMGLAKHKPYHCLMTLVTLFPAEVAISFIVLK